MKRYAIRTFYDGTNYHGYQRQPKLPTVEGFLIKALKETNYIETPEKNRFRSASRTDRYVNAIGNVFAFDTEKTPVLEQLNASLPSDKSIVCWSYAEVNKEFTPKYSETKKYWYILPSSHLKKKNNMNLEDISFLLSQFEGEHDFKLFCKVDDRSTVRTVNKCSILTKGNSMVFEIEANSFLWEQVRRMVSYVLNYKELPEKFQKIQKLLRTDTSIENLNIEPAKPKQLILVEHNYENVEWNISRRAVEHVTNRCNTLLEGLRQEESMLESIQGFFESK
ncbi:tRNA pseudouridine(38-40) synthase TruA [Candidatus Heimdallarchaeota archaeon]|nr:MAG: tRNA pseudouridine(38-40) synthase TruA [Candidatus Heimdallarchaeota archaeon]